MPTGTTSTVGGITLPVPAGAANSEITDLAVRVLLDYLAFWAKNTLDAKLAVITGSPQVSDACPTANRFPFDPATYHPRKALPALYVWWSGRSKRGPLTMLSDVREREIQATYIFGEQVAPLGLTVRHGLLSALDASWWKAAERGRHPSYGYGTDAPGTPVAQSAGMLAWEYLGGEPVFLDAIPAASANTGIGGGEGAVQRGLLALRAQFSIRERIDYDQAGAADLMPDLDTELETGDSTADTVLVHEGHLKAPDTTTDG